jgi:hypothetical protein
MAAEVPGSIDFVFDENKPDLSRAMSLYKEISDRPPFAECKNIVGRIIPGDDKKDLPLQSADLLAGQTRIYAKDKESAISCLK